MWRDWKPHVIWLDLRMPRMDGYDVAQAIRREEAGLGEERCIIVAMSASVFEEERSVALSRGCDDFLRKPFHETEIFERLHTHLHLQFVEPEDSETSLFEAGNALQNTDKIVSKLRALPDEQLERLQRAVTICDMRHIEEVITDIAKHHLLLAEHLRRRVENFEYTTILKMLEQC